MALPHLSKSAVTLRQHTLCSETVTPNENAAFTAVTICHILKYEPSTKSKTVITAIKNDFKTYYDFNRIRMYFTFWHMNKHFKFCISTY